MANLYEFSSDKIDIFCLNVDESGSMDGDSANVIEGLKMYKKSFENFPEVNSIAVSLSKFSYDFYPGEFTSISNMSTHYDAGGGTALYKSIVKGAKYLVSYVNEVANKTGCIPRATYIVFSDGESCTDDRTPASAAKAAINDLNMAGINTVFVAFGQAVSSEFGKKLGFTCTLDVNNRNTLVNFLGVELSKSCKEQSKSMKSLGENFFSQAMGNENSKGYSKATSQALNDDDWISDI